MQSLVNQTGRPYLRLLKSEFDKMVHFIGYTLRAERYIFYIIAMKPLEMKKVIHREKRSTTKNNNEYVG